MHRQPLLSFLNSYLPNDGEQQEVLNQLVDFIRREPNCFSRECLEGHLTASGWIIDPSKEQCVLVKHKTIGRWLQPGGHADGETNLTLVAKKEIEEETGLRSFKLESDEIFDLSIHKIPASKNIPEHLHYDVCFLVLASTTESLVTSHESDDVKWFSDEEFQEIQPDETIVRRHKKANLKQKQLP